MNIGWLIVFTVEFVERTLQVRLLLTYFTRDKALMCVCVFTAAISYFKTSKISYALIIIIIIIYGLVVVVVCRIIYTLGCVNREVSMVQLVT